jgi:mRNA interferase HigB
MENKRMRIVFHKKLKEFYETKGCEDSRIALQHWCDITEKAEWKNLSDIKMDFPATAYTGHNYRLVVIIKYSIGYIYIRWVGTHEDYKKIDCSTL